MTETAQPKKSDLGVRVVSAIVMVAVAGTALWLGGWVWTAFVTLVALGVLWEWWGLSHRIATSILARAIWLLAGIAYIFIGSEFLVGARLGAGGEWLATTIIGSVIATDIGAYFAGRGIGGPKIAPKISPSKTWAGLVGGIVAAAGWLLFANTVLGPFMLSDGMEPVLPSYPDLMIKALTSGAIIGVVAQSGDFFESWMKRRAGVKDSGNLLPGHGGLFDRTDGLLALLLYYAVTWG